jgi:ABC-2 type transport system permease protein
MFVIAYIVFGASTVLFTSIFSGISLLWDR